MPGEYGESVSPFPQATWGAQARASSAGNIVLGWLQGRAMEFSREKGSALPHAFSSVGKVLSYADDTDSGGDAYIEADWTDLDGNEVNFGPLFEPDVSLVLDKWWPNSDWTAGLTVHLTDSRQTSPASGASGQWGVLAGRAVDNPYKFILRDPLATAPAAGDKFEIGSLVWIVYPSIACPPRGGLVTLGMGELVMKELGSVPMAGQIEVYSSENKRELRSAAYPWAPQGLVAARYTKSMLQDMAEYSWDAKSPDGRGHKGREIAVAFRHVLAHGQDFKIDSVAYNVTVSDWRG